ncbi:hypothetical protein S40285_05419 [Stachybotrys chlorohalonatus IBT 40285]|uniref:HAT C-terminal dimerisation domain-containing protein n=1 Tax=Stachybotrys chlorohalonatus (strain IBT 40285) TaxID=1283841 RepID=A0A084QY94_STAC4|nr:hypothetical protein S40285_05419 [Stachybotrys chlorohalonata IBT 40285]
MLEGDGQIRKQKRFEFLLEQLERFKDIAKDFPNPEYFRININLGWQKLNEYYKILSKIPIYYTRLALYPAYWWKWLEFPKKQKTLDNPFQEYLQRNHYIVPEAGHNGLMPGKDEYLHWVMYYKSGDGSIDDPLAYWHEKRFKYPNLSRMALDFLTIQPMSAEYERLFLASGRIVNPLCRQLEAQIIRMCQVLRSWLRAGIIHDLDPIFISVQEEKVNVELAQMSDQQLEGWGNTVANSGGERSRQDGSQLEIGPLGVSGSSNWALRWAKPSRIASPS